MYRPGCRLGTPVFVNERTRKRWSFVPDPIGRIYDCFNLSLSPAFLDPKPITTSILISIYSQTSRESQTSRMEPSALGSESARMAQPSVDDCSLRRPGQTGGIFSSNSPHERFHAAQPLLLPLGWKGRRYLFLNRISDSPLLP